MNPILSKTEAKRRWIKAQKLDIAEPFGSGPKATQLAVEHLGLRLVKKEGPISIRDVDDDVLVEKDHPWASKKPSKKALQLRRSRN